LATYLRALGGITVGIWFCGGVANAQTASNKVKLQENIELSYIAELNPFDFVQQEAENLVSTTKTQQFQKSKSLNKSAQYSAKARTSSAPKSALQYRRKFSASSGQSQALYQTLVGKYGQPQSIRGQSHVWDIKNPNRGGTQADIVTVILKMADNGDYELIMDRDRGENGQATWAAPRLEKPVVQQSQSRKTRFQPILQPDND